MKIELLNDRQQPAYLIVYVLLERGLPVDRNSKSFSYIF